MTTPPVTTPALNAEPTDPAVTRILDAALEQFEDVGIRKSTVEDVARRAGVDRVTVYRRVGSKNDIAQAVVARESERLFNRVAASAAATESLEDRVVAAFTGIHSSMLTKQGVLNLDSEKQIANFVRTYIVPIVDGASPT